MTKGLDLLPAVGRALKDHRLATIPTQRNPVDPLNRDPPDRLDDPTFSGGAGPLAALTRRVKESFDPRRVLNPGRMYAGV